MEETALKAATCLHSARTRSAVLFVLGDVLDLLAEALEGYRTDAPIKRQTRCVTVPYADGMHLDLTPAGRHLHWPERESIIFHANTHPIAATPSAFCACR
jgi:hypothetical protein